MQLVADRFVIQSDGVQSDDVESVEREAVSSSTVARDVKDDDRSAVDLATGQSVWLSIDPSGPSADAGRWTARCDELHRLRHHTLAPLADYGPIGESDRFEAWLCTRATIVGDDHGRRAAAAASAFLRRVSLTGGTVPAFRMGHGERGALAVVSADAGYTDVADEGACESGEGVPGVLLIDRPAVTALAEMFVAVNDRRPRVAALWGPSGAGLDTAVLLLARSARMHGFVPVDSRLLDSHRLLLAERSLFIIERRTGGRLDPWLHALLHSSRPHVCLLAGGEEVRGVEGLALGRVATESLIAAVRPIPTGDLRRRIERSAENALGLPGRFVRALWPAPLLERGRRGSATSPRVAEQPAVYGHADAPIGVLLDPAVTNAPHVVRPWPSHGELVRLRRQVETANAWLAAGRHAPGLRLLRQAIGGLARRDACEEAARAGLTLAETVLRRGRPRDALRALDQARDRARRGADPTLLLDIAIAGGEAWTDLARLDDGERVFRGALASARAAGDRRRALLVATGLARNLFWRGAYADAASMLGSESTALAAVPMAVRRLRMLACARVAEGRTSDAMTALGEARNLAPVSSEAPLLVDVEHTEAFVRLRMGDVDGAERAAAECLASARRARLPFRALSARLMQAEIGRRRGQITDAAALEPLRRLAAAAPPLIRARWEMLKALVEHPDMADTAEQHAARSGLQALVLFARPAVRAPDPLADPGVEAIVAILHVCQHADDEPALLTAVCGRVRQQLHAAAVAFVVSRDGRMETIAAEGPRIETALAERAITVRQTIAPHRVHERLEAASAVLYGGVAIGALCARWTVGGADDLSRAVAVLSLAATAAAPVVSALLARRSQARPPLVPDLLGITSAMTDLRRAVERAGPAPFAVLIEGESGSGKELVARAIHRCSPRRDRAFATLNCAALPDDLVEAELFGHTRGAFTGAVADRPGVFEEAHGGTLFLDEIGELSPRAQAKILRVIQEGELRRVGENTARRIDVRIVSATNRDLRREVDAGRFRLDLLYRLDVIRISVPPLRERREDVAVLAEHFWLDATRRMGSHATLSISTRAALAAYDWPGNVRELQNVLAALAVRSPKRGVIPPSALPTHLATAVRRPVSWRLDSARRTFEEGFVRAALIRSGGHRGRTAADLGVTRQGLTKLMARLGIAE